MQIETRATLPNQITSAARVYVRPSGFVIGPVARELIAARRALPLTGRERHGFLALTLFVRSGDRACATTVNVPEYLAWAANQAAATTESVRRVVDRLSAPRATFAGYHADQPVIMGVLNVTPDSFSDGGQFLDAAAAIDHARAMAAAGASIIDIGGESTRPGAEPITIEDELTRVLPVLRALRDDPMTMSIDTRNAVTMSAALECGAAMVNDVTALTHDPASAVTVAQADAPVILMHSRGDPRTMQDDPVYAHAALDVYDALATRIARAEAAGISRARMIVDPGIGFGKTLAHNLQILDGIGLFHGLGCPVLLGASRKSFIGRLGYGKEAAKRVPGSLATVLAALQQGVHIVRVHDVAATAQAIAVWRAIHDPT